MKFHLVIDQTAQQELSTGVMLTVLVQLFFLCCHPLVYAKNQPTNRKQKLFGCIQPVWKRECPLVIFLKTYSVIFEAKR